MCLTSPMSFTACPHGQKLSKYAQHKYRKEDSGNFRGGKRKLKAFSLRRRAERVSSFNTVQTHVYNSESRVLEDSHLPDEFSRASSAAWRQQLKHRNCRSPSFEHPLPPSRYRYSKKFLGPKNGL